ncbi:MAG: MarR family transcriptional regulator [Pseudomonadota bacterium]
MGPDLSTAAPSRPSSLTVDHRPVFHDLARFRSTLFDTKLKPHGITISQAWVLAHLWRKNGLRQSELAAQMDVATVTTSKLIDRLEGHGFVERRVDPADRRSNRVFATDAGMALVKVLTKIVYQVDAVANEGIAEEELAITLRVIGRMRENLKAELARL